jgi:hypothetical protein
LQKGASRNYRPLEIVGAVVLLLVLEVVVDLGCAEDLFFVVVGDDADVFISADAEHLAVRLCGAGDVQRDDLCFWEYPEPPLEAVEDKNEQSLKK